MQALDEVRQPRGFRSVWQHAGFLRHAVLVACYSTGRLTGASSVGQQLGRRAQPGSPLLLLPGAPQVAATGSWAGRLGTSWSRMARPCSTSSRFRPRVSLAGSHGRCIPGG